MDIDQISNVITHATAPSFLLGAVAGFVSVLMARMNGVLDRVRLLNAIDPNDKERARLKSDLPRLQRRAKLLNDAVYLAVGSALSTVLLVILAFVSAIISLRHELIVAGIFVVALLFMGAALVNLGREVRIALTDHDYFG